MTFNKPIFVDKAYFHFPSFSLKLKKNQVPLTCLETEVHLYSKGINIMKDSLVVQGGHMSLCERILIYMTIICVLGSGSRDQMEQGRGNYFPSPEANIAKFLKYLVGLRHSTTSSVNVPQGCIVLRFSLLYVSSDNPPYKS